MRPSLLAIVFLLAPVAGCAVIYPELGTRTHTVPSGQPLEPPPPADLRWVRFVSGSIPEQTRDGRSWQSDGTVSTYAKLYVSGKEVLKTAVDPNTLTPTWPNSPRGNFKIAPDDHLRVEVWATGGVVDKPIIIRELGVPPDEQLMEKQIRVEEDLGARIVLAFEPAHPVAGLGLWYELKDRGCAVTRTLARSPAERAGILAGDEVVKIGTHEVKKMTAAEVQSAFAAVPVHGLQLVVKHNSGTVLDVVVKEGPIYATFEEFGNID